MLTSEILDRLPPQNLDAEKAVIGGLLMDSRLCDTTAAIIQADDFYADANKKLYRHILALDHNRQGVDVLLLVDHLKKVGDFEAIGGAAYLAEVSQSVPYAANTVYYANIVRKKSMLRNVINTATELLRDAYDPAVEPAELVNHAESVLSKIQTSECGECVKSAAQAVLEATQYIDEVMSRKTSMGIATGLETYDQNFGGMFPKELIILAARPSGGKTSLARQIARYNGEQGRLTYFASLEMDTIQQTILNMCSIAGVNNMRVRNADLQSSDMSKLAKAGSQYGQAAVYMEDRPRMKTQDILRTARRLMRKDLQLVVVDYLQLVKPTDTKQDRHLQVGEIARDLKSIAFELGVPVLCLCQLNRESLKSKEPDLHHLKESGDVEQHADVVMFLHDNFLLIKKNRNGPCGKIQLHWKPELTTFTCADATDMANYDHDLGQFSGNGF